MKNLSLILLAFLSLPIFVQAQGAGNPNNPYDYVGDVHNQTLAAIFPIVFEMEEEEINDPIVYEMIENYLNTHSGEFDGYDFTGALSTEMIQALEEADNMETNDYLQMKMNQGEISPELFDALIELFGFIDGIVDINILILTIQDFENRPWGELSELEKAMLFFTSSTARYSASFWDENYSLYSNDCCEAAYLVRMANEDVKDMIEADAEGAIAGGLAGAVVGSGAGGVGALPGAATGAVVGGTTKSIAKGVVKLAKKLWKWWKSR